MNFKEHELETLSGCPLYRGPDELKPDVYRICYGSLTWAVLRRFNHDGITLAMIQKKVEDGWIRFYKKKFGEEKDLDTQTLFYRWLRVAKTAMLRIFYLVTHFDVVHPVSPYQCILDGHSICGEYAMMRGKKQGSPARIIIPSIKNTKALGPDLAGIARWLDVRRQHPALGNILLHYLPLLSGTPSYTYLENEGVAKQSLSSALRALTGRNGACFSYPTMFQCRSCTGKGCEALLHA
jgi:hypothetical protein